MGQLDHADATNPNDVINLSFGIKASIGARRFAPQLQPALERVIGVVLIACVRVEVEGAGDQGGEAERLEVI